MCVHNNTTYTARIDSNIVVVQFLSDVTYTCKGVNNCYSFLKNFILFQHLDFVQ